jgi:hypothetical protein
MTEADLDLPTSPRLTPIASQDIRCKECGAYVCTIDLNKCKKGSDVALVVRVHCRNRKCPYTVEFEVVARD